MYSWITHTWNTIKGECPHGCFYCYMKRWGKQNPIRFDEKELKTDLGEGNFIFVGSSNDMFAEDIPKEWVMRTLNHCLKYYENSYLFQTKNPKGIKGLVFPEKSVFCTTIETNHWYFEFMANSPKPENRAYDMYEMMPDHKRYVTIEPIMDFQLESFIALIHLCNPIQVNIGADSGNNNLPEPPKEKILELIAELEKFTTVKKKKNLNRILNV